MNISKSNYDAIIAPPITVLPVPTSFHLVLATPWAVYGKMDNAATTLCIVYMTGDVVKIDLSDSCSTIDDINIYHDIHRLEIITDRSAFRFRISHDERILSQGTCCTVIPYESTTIRRHFIIDDDSATLNGVSFRDASATGNIIGSTFYDNCGGRAYIIIVTDKNAVEVYDVTDKPFLSVVHKYPDSFNFAAYKGMIVSEKVIFSLLEDAIIVSGINTPEVFAYKSIDVGRFGKLKSVSFVPNKVLQYNSVEYVFDDMVILTDRGVIYGDTFLHIPGSTIASVGDRHYLLIESENV